MIKIELTLFFIFLVIIVLFATYHIAKITLDLLSCILTKTVFKNAQKRIEEEQIKNLRFLKDLGIEIVSEHDPQKNSTSIR